MATLFEITQRLVLPLTLDTNARGKPVASAQKIRHSETLPHSTDNDSDSWRSYLSDGLDSAQHSILRLSDGLAALGQNPSGVEFHTPTAAEAAAGYALLVTESNNTAADSDFTPGNASVSFTTAPTSAVAIFIRLPIGVLPEDVEVLHSRSGATTAEAIFPRTVAEQWDNASIDGANSHYSYYALVETIGGDRVNYADVMDGGTFAMVLRSADVDVTHTVSSFNELPPVDSYGVGKLVAAGDTWYRMGFTNESVPNLFEGTVGRDTFNTTGGEHWRGISTNAHPNGFSTDGGFTANPDNAVSFVLASDERHLRWGIKKSVFDAAKGSAFVSTDKIAIKITYPDSSRIDEAVGNYYNLYTRNDGTRDVAYLVFQHHLNPSDTLGRTWDDGVAVRMGENTPEAVAGAPNGDIAVSGTTLNRIEFWDGDTWYRATAFPTGEAEILGLGFRSNGRLIAAGGNTDKIYTFDGASWDSGLDLPSADGTPAALAETRDGEIAFLGSQTRKIYTHDGTSWDSGIAIPTDETSPTGFAVDPGNGDWLLTGTATKKIYRRPYAGGDWTEETAVPTAEELPQGLGFSSDGDLLMVGVTTKKLYHFAIRRYRLYDEPAGNALEIEFLTVDGDGNATTTHFLTHNTQVKHWVEWNPDQEPPSHDVEAIALANRARLDALDAEVEGATPIHTHTLTPDNVALDGTSTTGRAFRYIASTVLSDDVVVMAWEDLHVYSGGFFHKLSGSTDARGELYLRAGDVGTTPISGRLGLTVGFNRQASDSLVDPAFSRSTIYVEHSNGKLYVDFQLNTTSNRALIPAAGFRLKIDVYRNTPAAAATLSIPGRLSRLQEELDSAHALITELQGNRGFAEGPELFTVTSGGTGLNNRSWDITDTTNVTALNTGGGGGWTHYVSMDIHHFDTACWGLIAEVQRAGAAVSRIFLSWSDFWDTRHRLVGYWRNSGTADNDRIQGELHATAGTFRLRLNCGGADTSSVVVFYQAR